jgi:hypothetical protein
VLLLFVGALQTSSLKTDPELLFNIAAQQICQAQNMVLDLFIVL